MTPQSFSWQEFSHSIIIDAPLESVFNLLSTAEGLEKWFIGKAIFSNEVDNLEGNLFPKAGDNYRWEWLAKEFNSNGKVIGINAPYSVSYTFGDIFEVNLQTSEVDGRIRIDLIQEVKTNEPNKPFPYINCCVCWVFFLTNLKSVLESGIDLRERKVVDELLVNQ